MGQAAKQIEQEMQRLHKSWCKCPSWQLSRLSQTHDQQLHDRAVGSYVNPMGGGGKKFVCLFLDTLWEGWVSVPVMMQMSFVTIVMSFTDLRSTATCQGHRKVWKSRGGWGRGSISNPSFFKDKVLLQFLQKWRMDCLPSCPPSIFNGPTYSKASEQALIYAYLFNSRITVFTKDTYKYI